MKISFVPDVRTLVPFLTKLQTDLRSLGHEFSWVIDASGLSLAITEATERLSPDHLNEKWDSAHTRAHRSLIERNRKELDRIFVEAGIAAYTPQQKIDTSNIQLSVQPLEKSHESVIFYFSHYPRANSFPRGRQKSFLVWDEGQNQRCLVGMLTLASPQYFQTSRDRLLNWVEEDNKTAIQPRKNEGLKAIYNISNCFAFGCYQHVFGSKIIALLSFTDVVAKEIEKTYKLAPYGFSTSSAFGSYASTFQRTNRKHFFAGVDRAFFKRLNTIRPSFAKLHDAISPATLEEAVKLASLDSTQWKPHRPDRLSQRDKHRALNVLLMQLGVPSSALRGGKTSSYFGWATDEALSALQAFETPPIPEPATISLRQLQDYWQEYWIQGKGRNGIFEYNVDPI